MTSDKILVPIDFSVVTPTVINTAIALAHKTAYGLVLMHVKHINSDPELDDKLQGLTEETNALVPCSSVMRWGSIFSEIALEAKNSQYAFALIGSHGFKGFREVMFGADILKLIKSMPLPVFTVLKDYVFPENGFRNILLPVASHSTFHQLIEATIKFAQLFDALVHIYAVKKPDLEWTQQLIDNIQLAETTFAKQSVKYVRVNEPSSSFSIGYSKQTLEYADKIQADLISMMSIPAKEHFYFADGDKEQLLTNKSNIPVISSG